MSEVKLKPCPFCGGEAKLKKGFPNQQNNKLKYAFVQCEKCHAKSATSVQYAFESYEDTKKYAIQNWNNRADDVVSKSAYDRLMWEYGTVLEQLRVIRLSFAEEPVDVVKIVRCKDCLYHQSCTYEENFKTAKTPDENMFCGVGTKKYKNTDEIDKIMTIISQSEDVLRKELEENAIKEKLSILNAQQRG